VDLSAGMVEIAREVHRDRGIAFRQGDFIGRDVMHVDSFLEQDVDLDFHFFLMPAVLAALQEAGLDPEMHLERSPYVLQEYASTRGYVLARRRP
jgi:hypothetical protein